MNDKDYLKSEILKYPEIIDTKQMMYICGYKTAKTIYRILSTGKIKYIRIGGQYRIFRDSVLGYVLQSKCLDENFESATETMAEYYKKLFENENELLTVKDVMRLTGYAKSSIQRWILSGDLEAFKIKYEMIIPRECLIRFMVSKRFRKITRKSSLHMEQLKIFRDEVIQND